MPRRRLFFQGEASFRRHGGYCGGKVIHRIKLFIPCRGFAAYVLRPGSHEQQAPFGTYLEIFAPGLETIFKSAVSQPDNRAAHLQCLTHDLLLSRMNKRGNRYGSMRDFPHTFIFIDGKFRIAPFAMNPDRHKIVMPQEKYITEDCILLISNIQMKITPE